MYNSANRCNLFFPCNSSFTEKYVTVNSIEKTLLNGNVQTSIST